MVEIIGGRDVRYHFHIPGRARTQQSGFGAMLSIEFKGGLSAVQAFVSGLRIFTLAESLGGTESLIAHPTTMTHARMSPEARSAAGVHDGILRLSIGLEGQADILADISGGISKLVA